MKLDRVRFENDPEIPAYGEWECPECRNRFYGPDKDDGCHLRRCTSVGYDSCVWIFGPAGATLTPLHPAVTQEMLDAAKEKAMLKNLDELFAAMLRHDPSTGDQPELEWTGWSTSLPTFGGDPFDEVGVWSWDTDRVICGSCADDLAIIPRDEFDEYAMSFNDVAVLVAELADAYEAA